MANKLANRFRLKFILFSMGLATAIGSAVTSIIMLYISMLGGRSIVYESNFIIAFVETLFLLLSVGTCVTASEIYYEYLEMKSQLKQKTC